MYLCKNAIHDMVAWNALPVEEQEKVIGLMQISDVELHQMRKNEERP